MIKENTKLYVKGKKNAIKLEQKVHKNVCMRNVSAYTKNNRHQTETTALRYYRFREGINYQKIIQLKMSLTVTRDTTRSTKLL